MVSHDWWSLKILARLSVRLGALGIGREAVTFRGDIENGFADLRDGPEA